MKRAKYIFLLFTIVFFACEQNSVTTVDLLTQAQKVVETDPQKALSLLDSIPTPEEMDEYNYMQYIVARVQAKDECRDGLDITEDTLVFKTPRYFENRKEFDKAALAHFYSGNVHFERKAHDKAIESYQKSLELAKQTGNYIMEGRSYNNIGWTYFGNKMVDSAHVNYYKALECFNNEEGAGFPTMIVYSSLGRVFNLKNELDSTLHYFTIGLELAEQLDNARFKHQFTRYLGVVNRDLGNYSIASQFSHEALALGLNAQDSLNIYFNLIGLYDVQNKVDSTRYYIDNLKNRLPEIVNDQVRRGGYGSFSSYYKKLGNFEEALKYSELQKEVNEKIQKADSSRKLLEANQKHQQALHKKELDNVQLRSYLYIAIALSIILVIGLLSYVRHKRLKHEHREEIKKNELLKVENDLLNQKLNSFVFLQNVYLKLARKWNDIDTQVKALAEEYGATEEPTIYKEIGVLIGDLQHNANEQLIVWAKDYFKKQSFDDQMLDTLGDKNLLFLMLCHSGYSKQDIAAMLGIKEKRVFPRKLDLRRELKKLNIPDDRIEELVFDQSSNKECE